MVLRGVLDASFNNYVCIRGFAPLKDLAKYSKIDPKYQRQPNDEHVLEIADFIKQGEYLYSPEILLGMACDKFQSVETRRTTDRQDERRVVSLYDVLKDLVLPRHEADPKKCTCRGAQ